MSKQEQADRLQHLLNDRSLLRQKGSTYHQRAVAEAVEERGGRFAALSKPQIVGATPVLYPVQPSSSPWSQGIDQLTGIEPPLGYDINQIDIGEPAVSSLAAGNSSVGKSFPTPLPTDDSTSVLSTDGAGVTEEPSGSNPSKASVTPSSSTKLRRL